MSDMESIHFPTRFVHNMIAMSFLEHSGIPMKAWNFSFKEMGCIILKGLAEMYGYKKLALGYEAVIGPDTGIFMQQQLPCH